jgi:hypothetical protein
MNQFHFKRKCNKISAFMCEMQSLVCEQNMKKLLIYIPNIVDMVSEYVGSWDFSNKNLMAL